MINITDKRKCCGCTACQQACPKQCIEMREDEEGFLYPVVNINVCVECGLCEKVCMAHQPFEPLCEIPETFNCRSRDEGLRAESSSGGIFTVIATQIIKEGGVVIGASFKTDWTVCHEKAETLEEIVRFRTSKYVQSRLDNIFKETKKLLQSGRKVLFSGTPCQISGLHHYLRKEYDNLYTLDFVCHSIPSPKVWKMYLTQMAKNEKVTHVTFRNKSNGWNNYGLLIKSGNRVIDSGSNLENLYMRGFLEDLYTRPSCSQCMARNYTSHSDIMLADAWALDKYHPNLDDNKGMSQVLIVTKKGKNLFSKSVRGENVEIWNVPYVEVEPTSIHLPITASTKPHPYREYFFSLYNQKPLKELITYCLDQNDRRKRKIMFVKNVGRIFALDKIYQLWKKRRK